MDISSVSTASAQNYAPAERPEPARAERAEPVQEPARVEAPQQPQGQLGTMVDIKA